MTQPSICSPSATAARHSLSAGSISTPPLPTSVHYCPNRRIPHSTDPVRGASAVRCTWSRNTSLFNSAALTHCLHARTSIHNKEDHADLHANPTPPSTGAHLASAAPWLESAPHHLDARRSLPIHPADAPMHRPAELAAISFRARIGHVGHAAYSLQSPYVYHASGLLQIAVSALLHTNSSATPELGPRSTADTALENWYSWSD